MFERGRLTPGQVVTNAKLSTHNTGLAFDVVPVVNGAPAWNDQRLFDTVGALGKQLGLVWGGDWALPDRQHFETADAKAALKVLLEGARK